MSGKLYVVPTPVGNLDDMTLRAIRVLKEADMILAEDTRTSSVLMKHFGITTPMVSHHKYNEHDTVGGIVERLKGGEVIALVSDAGTPGISDPGFMLSRECRRQGVTVECLPGATAFVPALVSSGLPCDRFVFEGFLPPKKGRATRLAELAADTRTVAAHAAPARRRFRRRPPCRRLPRNLETARNNSQRHSFCTFLAFRGEPTERRDCYRDKRLRE